MMIVKCYRYRVRPNVVAEYLQLQRRVAEVFGQAGCLRSLILRPQNGEEWLDLMFFQSEEQIGEVERRAEELGAGELYERFLRLTGLQSDEIEQQVYVCAVDS